MMKNEKNIPQHIAIVMDGNGRWAKKRMLPRSMGHKAGRDTVRKMIEASVDFGVKILTVFAFSSENWQRPEEEVNQLMELFLSGLEKEVPALHKKKVRLRFIGNLKGLSETLQQRIAEAEALTRGNEVLQMVVAVNYGGQWDILQACEKVCQAIAKGEMQLDQLTPDKFSGFLSTEDLPPPDLFIRTSGELRISNFLLWQLAYTELYFTDVLWPDFDKAQLQLAIEEFSKRQRRYGKSS